MVRAGGSYPPGRGFKSLPCYHPDFQITKIWPHNRSKSSRLWGFSLHRTCHFAPLDIIHISFDGPKIGPKNDLREFGPIMPVSPYIPRTCGNWRAACGDRSGHPPADAGQWETGLVMAIFRACLGQSFHIGLEKPLAAKKTFLEPIIDFLEPIWSHCWRMTRPLR